MGSYMPTASKQHRFTAKQAAFIKWYCSAMVNMNGTEAARRAGYKGNDRTLAAVAIENLGKPMIREEIDRRIAGATAAAGVTVEKILWELQVTYERASEAEKYSAAVRCLELQGKYLKMFSDRIEHVQSIDSVTTEDLIRLLREIADSGGIDLANLVLGLPTRNPN